MANPSISIDDETLREFDAIIEAKKEALGPDVEIYRSHVIESLMEGYIDDNQHYLDSGNVIGLTMRN